MEKIVDVDVDETVQKLDTILCFGLYKLVDGLEFLILDY